VKISAKILRTNNTKEIDLKKDSTVNDLLEKLNLKPDTLIVMRNNTPIPIDDIINDGDKFEIIQVSSGG
jgi:thiamine biosynthesis protein ThiS